MSYKHKRKSTLFKRGMEHYHPLVLMEAAKKELNGIKDYSGYSAIAEMKKRIGFVGSDEEVIEKYWESIKSRFTVEKEGTEKE